MGKNNKVKFEGLEQYLEATQNRGFTKYHNERTCYEAYQEIKKNLIKIQEVAVEGAMAEGIRDSLENYKTQIVDICGNTEEHYKTKKIHELFASDPVIFLNDHGPQHIEKVIEKANSILSTSKAPLLSEFETFLLLCAIQIHDIGNVLGRAGHERKLIEIFNEHSKDIIIDTPERRVINSIAMSHGGKGINGKDTISSLRSNEVIFNCPVRTRLLAAILRFSDELADDSTRANRVAIDLNILGTNSEIYHDYSRALHTVKVRLDSENGDCKVVLVYELETDYLKKTYNVGGYKKYLLDEIYDRTLKMELERRYCMKFMHQYVNIGRIDVCINIYARTTLESVKTISYTLEDVSYPELPITGGITTEWKIEVPSGEELLNNLIERGVIDDE